MYLCHEPHVKNAQAAIRSAQEVSPAVQSINRERKQECCGKKGRQAGRKKKRNLHRSAQHSGEKGKHKNQIKRTEPNQTESIDEGPRRWR